MRLLTNYLDSNQLRLTSELKGEFLMSYDNSEKVRNMATRYGFSLQPIAMKNTHHAEKTELLIGRGFDWFLD